MREAVRTTAQLAMDLAAMKAKRWYDAKHRPIQLQTGDRVYLNLHHGYHLAGRPSPKWSQKRLGPFTIKRMVNDLAAELSLPSSMKIHPVISVQHLKPAHTGAYVDPEPGPVEASHDMEGDDEGDVHYEIERLLDKRQLKNGTIKYKVRWKGWSPQYDQWVESTGISDAAIQTFEEQLAREKKSSTPRKSNRLKR